MQNDQLLLEKKVCSALIGIIERSPFYYAMLKRIPKIFRRDLTRPCALGIDERYGSFCILLNWEICIKASPEEIMIMLEHLLFHVFLSHQHKDRMTGGRFFHLAADLLINQNISLLQEYENGHVRRKSVFGNLLLATDLKDTPGFDLAQMDEKSVFEIWPVLEKKFGSPEHDLISTIDEDNFIIQNYLPISRFIELNPENQFKLDNQIRTTVIGAVKDLLKEGKSPGYLPEFFSRQLDAILGECAADYSSLIRKFAVRVKNKKHIKSWSKVNRRHPNQIKGKTVDKEMKAKLLLVMDTSGSMWQGKNLEIVLGEIRKLSKVCDDIWIVGGDVIEQFRLKVENNVFNANKFKVTGGGGTDLQFGYVAAKELGVDGVIALTDGHIPPVNSFGIPSLFVIVPGGVSVPEYENVFLI